MAQPLLDVAVHVLGPLPGQRAPVVLAHPDSAAAVALRAIARGLSTRSRGLAGCSLGLTPTGR